MSLVVTTYLNSSDISSLLADDQVLSLSKEQKWSELIEYLSTEGFTRPRGVISRSEFLLLTLSALPKIAVASAPVQLIWLEVLGTIRSVESITVSLPSIASMLSLAVSQGILTAEEVETISYVPTTKAGFLLGRDVQLTVDDLKAVLT